MGRTMSEEHARLVVGAYAAGYQNSSSPGYSTPEGRLLRRCLQAMSRRNDWPYSEIPDEVAFAMPPEVAEVYMTNPRALPLHDCEDCGYNLPHGYFDACPLCGGRIGWYAYWARRTRDAKDVKHEE
jgi:hypothetical protein